VNVMPLHNRDNAIPRNGIYHILVCRPNHRLGNMILVTPLIAELEQLYKGAETDIVAEGDIASDVFQSFSSVKNIYCLPRRGFKHPFVFLSKILKIRKTWYDLIIDPCLGSGFSRALTRVFKGTRKLGFDDQISCQVPCDSLTHRVWRLNAARDAMAQLYQSMRT
jgi:heptosyltransferase-3